MRYLLGGDSHCDASFVVWLLNVAEKFDCGAVVVVGDFGFWPKFREGVKFLDNASEVACRVGIPVLWLDGNHEDFDSLEDVYGGLSRRSDPIEIRRNVFYLPRGCRWEVDGVSFMTIGGGFSIDRAKRKLGVDWFTQETLTLDDVKYCVGLEPVDVIFSHDAPLNVPIRTYTGHYRDYPESNMSRRLLQNIVDYHEPKVLVHGHHHVAYNAFIDGVKVVGLAHNATIGTGDAFTVLDTKDFHGTSV